MSDFIQHLFLAKSPVHCERRGAACPPRARLCEAAAGRETAVGVVASGGSGADAGAAGAAGERTAPVAVETGIGSTQRDAACGRVGPGCCTQGARALAAPSHLMRKRRRNAAKTVTLAKKRRTDTFLLDSHAHVLHSLLQHRYPHFSLSASHIPINI